MLAKSDSRVGALSPLDVIYHLCYVGNGSGGNLCVCFDSQLVPYCALARERAVRGLPPGFAEAWLSLSPPAEKKGPWFLYV